MKRNALVDDYMVKKEKDYTPLIKNLIAQLAKNDDRAIKDLALAVKAVSEKKPDVFKQDNTEVMFVLEKMIGELKSMYHSSIQNAMELSSAIRDMEKPEIIFNPSIAQSAQKAVSYKFDIKRNTANLITEVVATPIGG